MRGVEDRKWRVEDGGTMMEEGYGGRRGVVGGWV
jgi:hypothetical protein